MFKLLLLLALLPLGALADTSTDLGSGIAQSEKGAANGVATLDGTGKVPLAQIPGGGGGSAAWGAITGTLSDQTDLQTALNGKQATITAGTTLQYYRGDKTFQTLNTTVVPEGTNLYYTSARFAADLLTKTTDDLTEGATNLYFTVARARAAVIASSIVNGDLTHSPDGNSVFDALALKEDALGFTPEDVANKDTDGTLAADSDTKYPSQKAVKTYVDNHSLSFPLVAPEGGVGTGYAFNESGTDTSMSSPSDGRIDFWNNASLGMYLTGGALNVTTDVETPSVISPLFGTNTATDVAVVANGTNQVTYSNTGGWSSDQHRVPADGSSLNQYFLRTNIDPGVSTTTANYTNFYSSMNYDQPDGGFDFGGNLYSGAFRWEHNSSGTVANGETLDVSSYFGANAAKATSFTGLNVSNGIDNGADVGSFRGVTNNLNSTGATLGGINMLGVGTTVTDGVLGTTNILNANTTFSGTTAITGGFNGLLHNLNMSDSASISGTVYGNYNTLALSDTASIGGGIEAQGTNIQLSGNAQATAGNTYLEHNTLSVIDSADIGSVDGLNQNIQLQGSATALNIGSLNTGLGLSGTSSVSSYNGLSLNPQMENTSHIGNVTLIAASSNIHDSATVDNFTGMQLNPQFSGSSVVTNFEGANIAPHLSGAAVATNGITGLAVQPGADTDLVSATGLRVDMSQAHLSQAAIDGGGTKRGIDVNDGTLNAGYNYTLSSPITFFQSHFLGGQITVPSGSPVAAFGFGTNLAQSVGIADDWSVDASGLGFVDVGFVGSVGVDAGKTLYSWTGALSGFQNPSGSGTVSNVFSFKAGGAIPGGGSISVTNNYGFATADGIFCSMGTNCWGFYDNSTADNYLNRLAIGTSTKKVANASTAIEIGNSKGFINGRGDTATKNALTAVTGMQFYDTDLNELDYYNGSTWVSTASGGSSSPRGTNTVSADYTISTLAKDYILNADTTGGAIAVTLPDAAASAGWCADVKNIGSPANTVTVDAFSGQNVDGALTAVQTDTNESHRYCAVGGAWFIY